MREFYYVRTIQKVHLALIDMFNNIFVNKYSDVNQRQVVKTVKVPVIASGYDKNFANYIRMIQQKRNIPVPVMGVKFNNAVPSNSGLTQFHYIRQYYSTSKGHYITDAMPIPHELTFTLDVLTESYRDYAQILENITPYFYGHRTLRIKEFEEYEEFERKVHVTIASPSFSANDPINRGPESKSFNLSISITCKCDFYRPRSVPGMINQIHMDMDYDRKLGNFSYPFAIDAFVYPTELIDEIRKPWETVSPTDFEGYSMLTSMSGQREFFVPSFNELDLKMDSSTDIEIDSSDWNRKFKFIGDSRTHLDGIADEAQVINQGGYTYLSGPEKRTYFTNNSVNVETNTIFLSTNLSVGDVVKFAYETGSATNTLPSPLNDVDEYIVTSNSANNYTLTRKIDSIPVDFTSPIGSGYVLSTRNWNQILSWFGSDEGLMEHPYTFEIRLAFGEQTDPGTIFQSIFNKQVGEIGEPNFVPANSVWYVWGVDHESKLYFTFRTTGLNALAYTFKSVSPISIETDKMYTFKFTLYDNGYSGKHYMAVGSNPTSELKTERVSL